MASPAPAASSEPVKIMRSADRERRNTFRVAGLDWVIDWLPFQPKVNA
jgi:hypothetical protein